MGHHHHHVLAEGERPFPLLPLLGAGSLVIFSLLSVAWLQWFGKPTLATAPPPAIVAERQLAFEDSQAGEVLVRDAESGEEIARFASGEQGFLRSTLRGLARARRARGAGADTPFRLEQRASGQLLLIDPVTGQAVDLWAFGQSNAQVFTTFLPTETQSNDAGDAGATAVAQTATRSNEP